MTMLAVLLVALLFLGQSSCTPAASVGEESRETFEVWLCPEHTDEQASVPGPCPICQRDMVKRLLVRSYSCPMHPQIDAEEPGACPICSMDLVATTRELQWYCPDDPTQISSLPGETCSVSGEPMAVRSVPRAHGDHNPRHGGILFMTPDGYHHLEGLLSPDGEFRLYFYNDLTEPVDASIFAARIGDQLLEPAEDNAYLAASLPPPKAYPVEIVLHVRFARMEEESRFDFLFPENLGHRASHE
jgi:Heavy metal binding domain